MPWYPHGPLTTVPSPTSGLIRSGGCLRRLGRRISSNNFLRYNGFHAMLDLNIPICADFQNVNYLARRSSGASVGIPIAWPSTAGVSFISRLSNMSISYSRHCTTPRALGFIMSTPRGVSGAPDNLGSMVVLPLLTISPAYVMHFQSTDVADSPNSVGACETSQFT